MTRFVTWRIMDLVSFNKSFGNVEINIRKYILTVTIFICLLFIIVLFNNKIEDYLIIESKINNKKIEFITDIDHLDKITNNNELIIERKTFTYKIDKIDDYIYEDKLYKKVILVVDNLDENILIDNNVIKIKIIIDKSTVFKYLQKTLKGDE